MKDNFLKKILSVPNYLSLPVAGIEICNKSVKYIEFINKNGIFSVKNFGEVFLPASSVKDGEILNKSSLEKVLIEVKGKISCDFAKISIPEEQTYIFDVLIPKEAKVNIKETLEFKIEENVPLKLEESSFEYEIIDEKSSEEIMLSVSVIPKKIISEYAEIMNRVGICALSFEIESKMTALAVVPKKDKRNSIIVNVKDDSTVFIAVIEGFARSSSSVPVGESAMKESLLKTGLFNDKTAVDKFFEDDFSFETTLTKEAYLSLVNIFSVLKDEVEKFNEYIINEFPETKKIDRIILCGRGSTLSGFAKHINQNLKIEIALADVFSNVFDIQKSIASMKFKDSLIFATPIGLVLSSHKETNA